MPISFQLVALTVVTVQDTILMMNPEDILNYTELMNLNTQILQISQNILNFNLHNSPSVGHPPNLSPTPTFAITFRVLLISTLIIVSIPFV